MPLEHPVPSPDVAIARAAAAILAARRPLLMFGAGASRAHLAPALSAFVRRDAPSVLQYADGQGRGRAARRISIWARRRSASAITSIARSICADLIVTIGHETVEKPPFVMAHGEKSGHPHRLHARHDRGDLCAPDGSHRRHRQWPSIALAGCLEGKLDQSPDLLSLRDSILAHIAERADDDRFPLIPQRIVRDVRRVMPPDGIVALDNGMYKIWFARNYRTDVANTLLLDNALATMGAGLPSGMMAALLYPERRVLAVCGDGGFMMNSQELETALRLRLNLVVLIIEDGGYGMIRWKQAVDGFADWGLQFNNPDFVAYARAYGASGRRVRRRRAGPGTRRGVRRRRRPPDHGSHRLQRKRPRSRR